LNKPIKSKRHGTVLCLYHKIDILPDIILFVLQVTIKQGDISPLQQDSLVQLDTAICSNTFYQIIYKRGDGNPVSYAKLRAVFTTHAAITFGINPIFGASNISSYLPDRYLSIYMPVSPFRVADRQDYTFR